jgi:fructokinase
MTPPKVFCFGEVLWDLFPEGKKIGGAPLNVALGLRRFQVDSQMISAVGEDALGAELMAYLKQHQLHSKVQENTLPTGTVEVQLDAGGSASYTITGPVAWDAIAVNATLETAVAQSQALVFGSLATRNSESYTTLQTLIKHAPFKVFDVNLRPPHYAIAQLEVLMQSADLIKFNDEELLEISSALGSATKDLKANIEFIAQHTKTPLICVTQGAEGALVYDQGNWYSSKGFPIQVADTVGAGDAFLATLIAGVLHDHPMEEVLRRACAMGALVASKAGANPEIHPNELQTLLAS